MEGGDLALENNKLRASLKKMDDLIFQKNNLISKINEYQKREEEQKEEMYEVEKERQLLQENWENEQKLKDEVWKKLKQMEVSYFEI